MPNTTASSTVPLSRLGVAAGPTRRAVVATGAWAVPAVVLASGAPAFAAASNQMTLTIAGPPQGLASTGPNTIVVTARDAVGLPAVGVAVSLSGPPSLLFAKSDGVTNADGTFTTAATLDKPWIDPGSTVEIAAVSDGTQHVQVFTVLGSDLLVAGVNSFGELGVGSVGAVSVPVQSSRVFSAPVVSVASGVGFSLAVLTDGSVWATGRNNAGQLGVGDTADRSSWVQVVLPKKATQVATTDASGYALLSDGTVYGWGSNGSGRLGDGTQDGRVSPAVVPGAVNVTQLAATGAALVVLNASGEVSACGWNYSGELGTRDTGDRFTLTKVAGLGVVKQIAVGFHFVLALVGDKVWAWGGNPTGQLGDGTQTDRLVPFQIRDLSGITQIAAGGDSGFAVDSSGKGYSWGRNDAGQCDNGGVSDTNSPVASVLTPQPMVQFTKISRIVGTWKGGAAEADGAIWVWGANDAGQCGDGTTDSPRAWAVKPLTTNSAYAGLANASTATATGIFLRAV